MSLRLRLSITGVIETATLSSNVQLQKCLQSGHTINMPPQTSIGGAYHCLPFLLTSMLISGLLRPIVSVRISRDQQGYG